MVSSAFVDASNAIVLHLVCWNNDNDDDSLLGGKDRGHPVAESRVIVIERWITSENKRCIKNKVQRSSSNDVQRIVALITNEDVSE